jgi:hypothetical protein
MGDKEIAITAVAQAIPVFAMMVFKILKTFTKEFLIPYLNSGGVMRKSIKGCFGKLGGSCC